MNIYWWFLIKSRGPAAVAVAVQCRRYPALLMRSWSDQWQLEAPPLIASSLFTAAFLDERSHFYRTAVKQYAPLDTNDYVLVAFSSLLTFMFPILGAIIICSASGTKKTLVVKKRDIFWLKRYRSIYRQTICEEEWSDGRLWFYPFTLPSASTSWWDFVGGPKQFSLACLLSCWFHVFHPEILFLHLENLQWWSVFSVCDLFTYWKWPIKEWVWDIFQASLSFGSSYDGWMDGWIGIVTFGQLLPENNTICDHILHHIL